MTYYATTLEEVLALRSENAQLRAALEPFAKLADVADKNHKDSRPAVYGISTQTLAAITIGDLRRAKAAHTSATGRADG